MGLGKHILSTLWLQSHAQGHCHWMFGGPPPTSPARRTQTRGSAAPLRAGWAPGRTSSSDSFWLDWPSSSLLWKWVDSRARCLRMSPRRDNGPHCLGRGGCTPSPVSLIPRSRAVSSCDRDTDLKEGTFSLVSSHLRLKKFIQPPLNFAKKARGSCTNILPALHNGRDQRGIRTLALWSQDTGHLRPRWLRRDLSSK